MRLEDKVFNISILHYYTFGLYHTLNKYCVILKVFVLHMQVHLTQNKHLTNYIQKQLNGYVRVCVCV